MNRGARMGTVAVMDGGDLRVLLHAGTFPDFDEFRKVSAPAVALDGAVTGPSRITDSHASFDHHEACCRVHTPATCTQILDAITSGVPVVMQAPLDVHINDVDADVALSVWLLRHRRRLLTLPAGVAQRLRALIAAECLVDRSYGLRELSGRAGQALRWVAAPTFAGRTLDTLDAVAARADRFVFDGRYGLLPAGPDVVVHHRRDTVALISESSPLGRAQLAGLGIRYFVSVQGPGRFSIGTTDFPSQADTVSLTGVFDALNVADDAASGSNIWGGNPLIGGSPRQTGSALTAETVFDAVVSHVASSGDMVQRDLPCCQPDGAEGGQRGTSPHHNDPPASAGRRSQP